MNPRPITNVTPGGAGTGMAKRSGLALPVLAVIVLLLLFGVYKLLHHRNASEKLAASVTKAIAANDMRPVEKDFNALRRPELENRAKVGRLSDFENADGAFKGIKEDTPSGSPAGYHHFIVHFEKGDLAEKMTLDEDGKIADFHVFPPSSSSQ